jgi:hypothetical protein
MDRQRGVVQPAQPGRGGKLKARLPDENGTEGLDTARRRKVLNDILFDGLVDSISRVWPNYLVSLPV